MNALYEIAAEYRGLLEQLLNTANEDGEVDEEVYALVSKAQGELEAKAKNCAGMYLELESEIERIKRFESKIKARREKLERRAEWIKGYIDRNLRAAGVERIEGEYVTVKYQKGERVEIDNEAEIPEEYWRVKREPDKGAIRAALKEGKGMGAHLESTRNIQIK